MLHLDDFWVWDLWLADDSHKYHMFFLYAPRELPSPADRHFNARIGHAVSDDLVSWERVQDALGPAPSPAFDDLATWTGSVVRGDDDRWYLFYTGASKAEDGLVQRIGLATSEDLVSWERVGQILAADPRWYEVLGQSSWPDQAWRDPWVVRATDEAKAKWHMLLTARAKEGPVADRGVIGHAISDDLVHWVARPPLSAPGQGFGQLEVPQIETIAGRHVLVFSCLGGELARPNSRGAGGIWIATGSSQLGEWDIRGAQRLTDERLYAGRLVRGRRNELVMLAFRNTGVGEQFVGDISDPLPLIIKGKELLPSFISAF